MTTLTQVLVGPRRHGVVRFGLALDTALRHHVRCTRLRWVADAAEAPGCLAVESQVVHAQFTDRLFGTDPDAAASSFVALARAARHHGSALTATLHDLPQPSDGTHHAARSRAYRTVAAACDRIVVSSRHEQNLLRDNAIGDDKVSVVPLPITSPGDSAGPRPAHPPTLGIFGFIYPGKGHADVIAAAQGLPREIEVHALGATSPGHDDLVADLRRAAAQHGRPFHVTGHIADRDLVGTLRSITVPVAAHRHISASGSLNTWLEAGRRPLAPASRYTEETERRNPGCLQLFCDTAAGLRAAIRRALQDPSTTWLPAATTLHPSPDEAAAGYAAMFASVAR